MGLTLTTRPAGLLRHFSWPWAVTLGYLGVMLLLPTLALIAKAGTETPADIWRIATDPVAVSAYQVTVGASLAAALVNTPFGVLVAWVLVRYPFPGRRVVDAMVDLPFALPTSVAGLTLATIYSDTGWLGSLLAPLGIKVSFTVYGVFVALVFISLPFVIRTVQPVLQEMQSEPEIEEAARSLGANAPQTFWRVTLPPLMPAILTGFALGFSRAVGEFGSVVIIASGIPYKDLVAPVLVFQRLEQYDYSGATVIGVVLILISLVVLLGINLIQVWGKRYG